MSRSGGLGHEMLAPEGVERIDVEALYERMGLDFEVLGSG